MLLVARRIDALLAAAEHIRKAVPAARIEVLSLDITAPDAPQQIDQALVRAGGELDLLVNSAGIGLAGSFAGQSPAEIDRVLQLNMVALTRLMRHVLPGLAARRRGGILNIASLGAYLPGPNQAVYYASKAYVVSLTEAVAAEMAGTGVKVNVVSPGPVETRFHARMGADRALYRWLIPAMRPQTVAVWALIAHDLGLRATAPGIINSFLMILLHIVPHRILVPVVGWLLKPRP